MGKIKRVFRKSHRRHTPPAVLSGLLLGTGILATAAVGYLLNRNHKTTIAHKAAHQLATETDSPPPPIEISSTPPGQPEGKAPPAPPA